MALSKFFNAQHSPIGAFASFTLGAKGPQGGMGLELGAPANQPIFIGIETADLEFHALPFFGEEIDRSTEFDVEKDVIHRTEVSLKAMPEDAIHREYTPTTDIWKSGALTAAIYTQVAGIPDPATAKQEDLKAVLVPAVWGEYTFDNTAGTETQRLVVGFVNNDSYGIRHIDHDGLIGIGPGRHMAFVTDNPRAYSVNGFTFNQALTRSSVSNRKWMLGGACLLVLEVPAGEVGTLRVAHCFYRQGLVTTGIDCNYLYNRYFADLDHVAAYALSRFDAVKSASVSMNAKLNRPDLNEDQRFQLAHSIHSYFGSTQLLEKEGKPVWVVNEGEYRMINTFDLIADHLFFELEFNPWVVKNLLDHYVDRYSYYEEIGGEQALGFTHDMGVANQFSRPGYSSYERGCLTDCFSYMTHEELVNWLLCAATYVHKTGDKDWVHANAAIFEAGLKSMALRDNPNPAERNGIMSIDSVRCEGGAEITTYDSLDTSLGQSRGNLYLAVKCFAAYVILAKNMDGPSAALAESQAKLCAATIVGLPKVDGVLPAVIDPLVPTPIIPTVEGLAFLYANNLFDSVAKDPAYAPLIEALKVHIQQVLRPGACLFEDGGWKLSATSNNSWLSKIYLCQYVTRKLLGQPLSTYASADAAHVQWLMNPESLYWAWSDQIVSGVAMGSKYYPRGVTSILWLSE